MCWETGKKGMVVRCQVNMAHITQSRPDSGLGFQAKKLDTVSVVPCLLECGLGLCAHPFYASALQDPLANTRSCCLSLLSRLSFTLTLPPLSLCLSIPLSHTHSPPFVSLSLPPSLQVNYAMAISPVAMIPEALPLATLQVQALPTEVKDFEGLNRRIVPGSCHSRRPLEIVGCIREYAFG